MLSLFVAVLLGSFFAAYVLDVPAGKGCFLALFSHSLGLPTSCVGLVLVVVLLCTLCCRWASLFIGALLSLSWVSERFGVLRGVTVPSCRGASNVHMQVSIGFLMSARCMDLGTLLKLVPAIHDVVSVM